MLLLEKEQFPRFHIGESLLPACIPLLDELGVHDAVRAESLQKNAAEFVTGDGSVARRYTFGDGLVRGSTFAYEVERATFDRILLDNARQAGVTVRQGVEVNGFSLEKKGVEVVTSAGVEQGRFLIDASGQRSLVASRLELREMDRELKSFAMYAHYEGAERHPGEREGDITIILLPVGWWWVIPLRGNRTSVGFVAPSRSLTGEKPDAEYFDARVRESSLLAKRLAPGRRIGKVTACSDYSYASRRFVGDRWLLVGDAAAFLDPVFSTGVCLGMLQAFRAADAVDRALGATPRALAFRSYERYVKRSVSIYRDLVKGFYTPELVELLMAPTDRLELRRAITSLLSGEGIDRFPIAWRISLFRSLAKANRVLPLVPRLPGIRAP